MDKEMRLLRNAWDLSHILGGVICCWLFRFFIVGAELLSPAMNFVAFLILGCVGSTLKELADEISKGTQFEGKWGLDPSGGDIGDIYRALFGSTSASFFLLIFDKL